LKLNYIICSVWLEAHDYCVLGPCLLALGWHLGMPGYSPKGLGVFMCLESWHANNCIVPFSFFLNTLVVHKGLSLVVEEPVDVRYLVSKSPRSWWAVFCLILWLEMYNISTSFLQLVTS